jgi:hypothetical protein
MVDRPRLLEAVADYLRRVQPVLQMALCFGVALGLFLYALEHRP